MSPPLRSNLRERTGGTGALQRRKQMEWPEFPPLDVQATARAIAEIWHREVRKMETENRELIYVSPRQTQDIYGQIVQLLENYDRCRGEALALYKAELIRLHSRIA